MLTPQEQQELAALEQEYGEKPIRMVASAPQRSPDNRAPGDIQHIPMSALGGMTPEEEAELFALEQEFGNRPAPAPETNEGFISQVGNIVDQYSGAASVRRGVGTLMDSGDIRQSISDAVDQYSQHPSMAPTGKELAMKAGISDESLLSFNVPVEGAQGRIVKDQYNRPLMKEEVSPAGMVGFAADMALDPLNLLPFAGVAAKKGLSSGRSFLRGSAKAAEAAAQTEKVAKEGGIVLDSAKVAVESGKEAKRSLVKLFRPDVSPDFQDYQRIAKENNIPTELLNEAHEFGQSSVISRHARSVAEGPLGAEKLQKHDALLSSISEAADNQVRKISGSDVVLNNADAGELIRESFDKGVDEFFNGMAETYNSALALAPDLALDKKSATILNSKLNQLEHWSKRRLGSTKGVEKIIDSALSSKKQVRSATGEMLDTLASTNKAITKEELSQAKEVLDAVKLVKNAMATTGGDLNQAVSALRDIGNIAFKKKKSLASIPSDQRKFQEIYFSLQKGITESIRSGLGDDFADALVKNNSEMSNFFTKRGALDRVLGDSGLASEKVFEKLVLNGDTKQLDSLFSIISPEAKAQLKGTFLNSQISRNADGAINFRTSRNNFLKLKKKGILNELYAPEELKAIDDILRLGDSAGSPILSSSGTGASNAFRDIYSTLKNKVEGDLIVEQMKKGARNRANFVEIAPGVEAPVKKGGFSALRSTPKTRSAQAAKIKSTQERNERLSAFERLKGAY